MAEEPNTRVYLSRDERRGILLDQAFGVLSEEGPEGLTMRRIAQRSGVVHGVVQYAFGSRGELIRALLEREAERIVERVWAEILLPSDASLSEVISCALTGYTDDLRRHPDHHLALTQLTAITRGDPELEGALRAEYDVLHAAIAARFAEWQERSGATDVAVWADVIVDAVIVAANGLTDWWLTARDDAALPAVVELLSAGFGSSPRSPQAFPGVDGVPPAER